MHNSSQTEIQNVGASISDPAARRFKLLRKYCETSAIGAVALGCVVLYGWAFHVEVLTSVFPGLVTMKANTALGLVFSGISLWLLLPGESAGRKRHLAHLLALLVTVLGAVSLSQYLFGLDLGIDQLLVSDPNGSLGTSSPGRMAPMTATALGAIGLALLLLDWKTRRGHRPAQVLSLGSGLIAMMAINGYIYHATALYTILLYTQVALHTAIALLLLSAAIFFARPGSGIAGDLTSEGSGSAMARRSLPAVFSIPILLGWVRLRGQLAGLYGTRLGLALYATSNIVVFAVLVWLSARKMNEEYEQRSKAEVAIRKLNAELEGRVAERTKTLEQQAAVLTEQAALLDLAQDAIVVRDMQGRILFWSRGAEGMFGWRSQEALGRNTDELLRTEFSENAEKSEAALLRQGQWEGEAIQHKRDGTRLTVTSRWALQYDAGGAPVRILSISNDITERKQAESRLLLLTERLSLATAVARVGVWEWDLASDMLTWDATMFEIYGFPATGPMQYEKWSAAVFPEDMAVLEVRLQRVIEEKGHGSEEFRITRSDGAIRNILAMEKAVLDVQANVIRVIGVNIDSTDVKAAEEVREQTAKDHLRLKDEFLSHVSHELRSPLTAIKQFTTILLGGLAGELNKEQRKYQKIILKNILQLQSMIDDLLEVTRLESRKLNVDPEGISVPDAVADTLDTLRGTARAKGLTLSYDLPADLPAAYADPTRVRQILIILIENAIKFTLSGGAVTVQARPREQDPEFLLLEVADTGCGIEPEMAERIFERLYQVAETTQASRKGLGLGLFICKELVTRQGGQIWVKSQPQKGSIFSFTLPVFSLNNLIAPLLKNDRWPVASLALVMVEISGLNDGPSKEAHEEWFREVRSIVQGCLMSDLDVFLRKVSCGAEGERFFVAAFADEKGATVLANRIRGQLERLPRLKQTGLAVSYLMLKSLPLEVGVSTKNMVTSMATHLEEAIKSQIVPEAIFHE